MIGSFLAVFLTAAATLPAWEFDTESDLNAWKANSMVSDISVKDGVLQGRCTGSDPFLSCTDISFPATPWQYVFMRILSDKPGEAQIFWTGDASGPLGGLSEEKSTRFTFNGNGDWQEIAIIPGWHRESVIKSLRFDQYEGLNFSIDRIAIVDWSNGETPLTSIPQGTLDSTPKGFWRQLPGGVLQVSPPLNIAAKDADWAMVQATVPQYLSGELFWISSEVQGLHREGFPMHPGWPESNIELVGHPAWIGAIQALALRLPENISAEQIMLSDVPQGPATPSLKYFGFVDGVNRAGRTCKVMAQFTNVGGGRVLPQEFKLVAKDPDLHIVRTADTVDLPGLMYGDVCDLVWEVETISPGQHPVALEGPRCLGNRETTLSFTEAVSTLKSDYVPPPKPVKLGMDVCMYYFPGWESEAKWDCIRRVAPIRKPLLGYYDESNPECVDWQIKWAVENGVNCFLVDWYWSNGSQFLTHWFEAYRKARYRDQLKVAIMWANHNAPNTHSREDWRKVTREWIDRYFNLPGYYRIKDKPAIFLWAPGNLRRDLGGSAEVHAALEESRGMARDAGYAGIEFIVVNDHDTRDQVAVIGAEGYDGATNYHEWGKAITMAPSPSEMRYADAVATAPAAWAVQTEKCAPNTYYPVVDTGWDSRPWHGNDSMVLGGRTVEGFEQLLRSGKAYCEANKLPFVVLGPANEWGEGSYVEPNTEFGFTMYEAIRRVFSLDPPAAWPVNYAPADLGLGPYDFPHKAYNPDWNFDDGPGAWTAMMNVSPLVCENGAIRFNTRSSDPALVVLTPGLNAGAYPKLKLRMSLLRLGGAGGALHGQVFWSVAGRATSEKASVLFECIADGAYHDYLLDLGANPHWRGDINSVRLDPCDSDVCGVLIDRIAFEK